MLAAGVPLPYPHWLSSGDNTWQLVAGVLVGLMSIPGIAVLYGGLVQKKSLEVVVPAMRWSVLTIGLRFSMTYR